MPETTLPPSPLNPSVKLVLKTVSQSGEQVAISVSVRIPPKPTYEVITGNTFITSLETALFEIITEHIPNGTELYWEIVLNDVTPSVFSEQTMEGVVIIEQNIATVTKETLTIPSDILKTAYISLNLFRDSEKQILVARSKKVVIYYASNDT